MPGPYRGYKRPRATKKSSNKPYTKSTKSTNTKRRKLVTLIKRTILKKAELKEKFTPVEKTNIYHNCFYNSTGVSTGLMIHLNNASFMPSQGAGDNQRVGDEINMSGFKLRMLIGQQADRPNVNWRWFVFKVPKGSSISYGNWFEATTNNILLDQPNRDFVKVLARGYWRPNEAGLAGGGGDEYTYSKQLWIPYKHTLKFGPGAAATTHNDDDVYFSLMGYDAFGTTILDIVGYVQTMVYLAYRDP